MTPHVKDRSRRFSHPKLRLDQLVTSDHRLKVHGRLSTHVHNGKPATGMEFELIELSQLAKSRGRRAVTTSDGGTDSALIAMARCRSAATS